MKNIFLLLISMTLTVMSFAQTPYTSTPDEKYPGGIILNGNISKYAIENNTAFDWYQKSRSGYTPETSILTALESAKNKVRFLIFGGTWCEDTQFILPKFFKLQELSGIPDNSISFFGVNREKKTLGNVADVFNITNVPTIIILKDGKETGRIVEYGKTGKWDSELAEMVK